MQSRLSLPQKFVIDAVQSSEHVSPTAVAAESTTYFVTGGAYKTAVQVPHAAYRDGWGHGRGGFMFIHILYVY